MKIPYLMEFDEPPRFWCPRLALVAYINFAFSSDENLQSDFRRSEKETKVRKNKNKKFSHAPFLPPVGSSLPLFDDFFFILLLLLYNNNNNIIIIIIIILDT